MYRPRRRRDLGDSFTLGGRVPASVGFLLALILAMSLGALFTRNALAEWSALHTPSLLRGEVWRLVTWPFIQLDPLGLIFGGMVVWFFAPPLAYEWGDRRFLLTILGITVAASVVTLLASVLLRTPAVYLGLWPIVDALIIFWALRNPDQQVMLYFVLPVSGRVLAWITVGTNALFLLFAVARQGVAGLVGFMPMITAMAIAWGMAGGRIGMPRRWRLGLRDWQMERQLRRRSKHLKVVRKNGEGGPPQWLN